MQTLNSIDPVQKRRNKPVIGSHHISSFGILNRNGLEITAATQDPEPEVATETAILPAEFTNWSMPVERPGYMQSRRHDFL
jgi:hypothetical protein